jgi:hypothetical protein
MSLPTKIIALESLMKRWGMSFNDIFLIVLNHDLSPVYRENEQTKWNKFNEDEDHDAVDLFIGESKSVYPILFLRDDVTRLEQDLGGGITKSDDVIDEGQILERWGIAGIELWNLVEECDLDVVDPVGTKIQDFHNHELQLLSYTGYEEVSWYFRLSDIEGIESQYGFEPKEDSGVSKQRKPRPSRVAKERCREVAAKIWEEDPDITIRGMSERPEILEVTKRPDGLYYLERTIRGWIKDLCPNRSPGRRPKKK